uniref:Photosynthetic NDH subcomplex L 2 n=1 Tax=Chenopodium quinoa TaxID=63459 RepID=A0A803MNG2_CHEQI
MTTILNPTITLLQTKIKKSPPYTHHQSPNSSAIRSLLSDDDENQTQRRKFMVTTLLGGLSINATCLPLKAQAEEMKWGTQDAVARIKNTAEGLHSLRHMLDTMSWRYVIFYIRLKEAYLKQDMKNAMSMVPEGRRDDYVNVANELVDNMAEVI